MSARRHWEGLPFILKLSNGVFRGKIQVNLSGGQPVMTQKGHKGSGGNSFFYAVDAAK
jgi:hypothetical protein